MNGENDEVKTHDDPETGAEETAVQVEVEEQGAIETIEDFENNAAQMLADLDAKGGESPEVEEGVEEEVAEDTPPEVEEPEVEEPETEEPTEPDGKSKRVRVRRPDDEAEARALDMYRENPALSLEECLKKVKGEAEEVDPNNTPEETQEPRQKDGPTLQGVLDEIEQLEAQELEAGDDMDFRKQAEIRQKITRLQRQEFDLRTKEAESQAIQHAREREEWDKQVSDSMESAVKYYPDVTKEDSALSKEMAIIDKQLQELDDDLYYAPDKPLKLAQMAARKLGIAPKTASAALKSPPRKAPVPSSPVMPAGGASRTQPTNSNAKLDAVLNAVETTEDFETVAERLLAGG